MRGPALIPAALNAELLLTTLLFSVRGWLPLCVRIPPPTCALLFWMMLLVKVTATAEVTYTPPPNSLRVGAFASPFLITNRSRLVAAETTTPRRAFCASMVDLPVWLVNPLSQPPERVTPLLSRTTSVLVPV